MIWLAALLWLLLDMVIEETGALPVVLGRMELEGGIHVCAGKVLWYVNGHHQYKKAIFLPFIHPLTFGGDKKKSRLLTHWLQVANRYPWRFCSGLVFLHLGDSYQNRIACLNATRWGLERNEYTKSPFCECPEFFTVPLPCKDMHILDDGRNQRKKVKFKSR